MSAIAEFVDGLLRRYGILPLVGAIPGGALIWVLAEANDLTAATAISVRERATVYVALAIYYATAFILLSIPVTMWRACKRCVRLHRRKLALQKQPTFAASASVAKPAQPDTTQRLDGVDELERRVLRIFIDHGQPSFNTDAFESLLSDLANEERLEVATLALAAVRLMRRDFLSTGESRSGKPVRKMSPYWFRTLSEQPWLVGSLAPPRKMAH